MVRNIKATMKSTAPRDALHLRGGCTPRRGAAPVSRSDSPERLICSLHGRVTRLFEESDLRALQERDSGAQDRLVSSFSRPVLIKLRAMLRSPELVQDAFQETFLRVFTYFGSGRTLERPAGLPGFIHVTCHNVALELLRGHTRHDQMPENHPGPVSGTPDPERQFVTQERKAFVQGLLNELSSRDRQLLKRVFLDEEDKDAVCRDFQVDRAYLRVLLYRARQSCLALLTRADKTRVAGG
jgi:RNA polymerase sigma-70 factor (ECF subfamily)